MTNDSYEATKQESLVRSTSGSRSSTAIGESTPRLYPSVWEHLIAGVVALTILEQHSRLPEANFLLVIVAFLAVLGLSIAWLARIPKYARTVPPGSGGWASLNWAVLPIALLLMISSAVTHWPATIRFRLSRSAFDALVVQAQQGNNLEGFPRRVGLYWIKSVQADEFDHETGQGNIGFVTGVALIDECGLYYDQTNTPSTHYLHTRIAPHWYLTEW